ncbi:hypothetical protein BUALT_Bualt19G0033200 [Buddleja alternifolia]|uniref:Uncharacterized protein n=1 Tax=Buddleja alternifolia TaxID=168488 RepID=A0AAV6W8G9_9LAMI|nr:hypothetical protein BUALT_Bualt19G0033200 [Buddleja alternifolia]
MGSQNKPHYNISMSRRTRKQPLNLKIEPQESSEEDEKEKFIISSRLEKDFKKQKSLKQLIESRCSLAQRFREEEQEKQKQKQKDIVVREQDEDGFKGTVKWKRIVRNYTEVLTHLIKVKQESYVMSWGKHASSVKLIKHK